MNNSLNRIFKVIWSKVQMAWVAVSEATTAHGKQQSLTRITRTITTVAVMAGAASIAAPPAWAAAPAANQLPTGGQVSAGIAAIGTSGNTMTVTQSSNRAVINWTGFDIGSAATVNFVQPSSTAVALNNVNSANPSQIYGTLSSNGQVYLVNAAGIYFAPGAQVNVGGIVATTMQMSDAAFMAGSTTFNRNGSTGKVVNDGTIQTSLNGYIAMLAPEVRNSGLLLAQAGTVAMAAGETITLNFGTDSKLASITVTAAQINTLVENRYAIKAPNGLVILSARAADQLASSVINSGTIEANGVSQQGGRILLEAANVTNTGTLNVSSDTAQAGTIQINGKNVSLSGTIIATSPLKGGSVNVQATQTLNVNASINASATNGTGVGGDIQLASNQITVNNGTLNADGDTQGGSVEITGTTNQPNNPFNNPLNLPVTPSSIALIGFTGISARSRSGQGGNATILGDSILLDGNTNINVSGATGGGTALIGGDWQGSNGTYQATTVTLTQNVTIDASATDTGNGGKVVLWSDVTNANSWTQVDGTILATGGPNGGNGGNIETSGHQLNTDGIQINAGATNGTGGLWLLDPADSTITQAVADTYAATLNNGTNVLNDVGGAIVWSSGVSLIKTSGGDATLTLRTGTNATVYGNITLNGATISSNSGKLNLVLWTANNTLGYGGTIIITNSTIATNGGQFWAGGGAQTSSTWNGLTVGDSGATNWGVGSALSLTNSTISTAAGNLFLSGLSWRSGTPTGTNYGIYISNSVLESTSGDIQVSGQLKGLYNNGSAVVLDATSVLHSTGGNITVTGNTSDSSGSPTGWRNGVDISGLIQSTNGAITIAGTESVSYSGGDSSSVVLRGGSKVVSQTGDITMTASNTASGYYDDGIRFYNNGSAILNGQPCQSHRRLFACGYDREW